MTKASKPARIRELNDELRTSGAGGLFVLTSGIQAFQEDVRAEVIAGVIEFDAFDPDNDPYSEHDFGSLTIQGHGIFWKIDYYDPSMQFGSEDPSDPSRTRRVLTITLAEEY